MYIIMTIQYFIVFSWFAKEQEDIWLIPITKVPTPMKHSTSFSFKDPGAALMETKPIQVYTNENRL